MVMTFQNLNQERRNKMGYTNYWTYEKPFTNKEWNLVKKEYEQIKNWKSALIEDQTEHIDEIRFNGLSQGDDDLSHETFVLLKDFTKKEPIYEGDNVAWNFCKTARKPYDLAVWYLLSFVKKNTKALKEISHDTR